MSVSIHAGMGATPYEGGVAFRVWAPFASSVSVAGTFNAWSPTAAPLGRDGGGYWSADVAGASIGDEYKFVLTSPFRPAALWKNDPYARSLTNSVGNSIIARVDFGWQTRGYSTPPWNELVIYELHVGSFHFDASSSNGRGNFDSVIAKLGYLRELGINAIQLLPSDEFPGDISWGYNPAYIFAIEQSYGGPDGLCRLVDAAHARGIAIIYDVVYNSDKSRGQIRHPCLGAGARSRSHANPIERPPRVGQVRTPRVAKTGRAGSPSASLFRGCLSRPGRAAGRRGGL